MAAEDSKDCSGCCLEHKNCGFISKEENDFSHIITYGPSEEYNLLEERLKQNAINYFNELQYDLAKWQTKNFKPEECTSEWMLVGATEELGEAAHVLLKSRQRIREYKDGMNDFAKEKLADAIADTCVYLMQLCSRTGLSFAKILIETSKEVMKRNWKDKKKDGVSE